MKFPKKALLILAALSPILSVNCQNQTVNEEEWLLYSTYEILQKNHFAKEKYKGDKAFFDRVLKIYLQLLDPRKIFFLKGEVEKIFDQYLPTKDLSPILSLPQETKDILLSRVDRYMEFSEKMLKNPISFEANENYQTDPQKVDYAQNEEELTEHWRKDIKYSVLNQIVLTLAPDASFKVNGSEDQKKQAANFNSVEKEKREAVWESIKKLNQVYQTKKPKDYLHDYLRAIALAYDHHTFYYPPVEKESFDLSTSGSFEGIGATISKTSDGLIEILGIVPGGPAYKQKELEVGDQIMKVGQGNEPAVDIQSLSLNEGLKLIRGKKGTIVKLTVKKKNGEIKTIAITRDRVSFEESFARSVVINKDNKKIGYLKLPSFYNDFSGKTKRNAADDVRKELSYLNKQNVEALVFDLRENGGGSLEDAIKIAGLFFETGPVLIVRSSSDNKVPLVDTDTSIAFEKPMVILINRSSASASEIVAAALKDMGRAVIVGSEQSFGKGTVQTIASLSDYYGGASRVPDLGAIKFTVQKFYRINGQSTHQLGVDSDIVLPELSPFNAKKNELFGRIENDSIDPVLYERWKKYGYNLPKLKRQSRERIKRNSAFANITKRKEISENFFEGTVKPLSFKKALDERKKYLTELAKYPLDFNKKLNFNVTPKPFTEQQKKQSGFEEKSKSYLDWIEGLEKDVYLDEALNIIEDTLQS